MELVGDGVYLIELVSIMLLVVNIVVYVEIVCDKVVLW